MSISSKPMRTTLLAAVLTCVAVATGCSYGTPYDDLPLRDALDAALRDAETDGFAGVALLARGDSVLLRRGVGLADRAAEVPWTPSTVFDVGSITKSFTAAAVLRLDERGRLSVSDRLADHLPGVPPDKRTVTLHHLLTHSAGFPDVLGGEYRVEDDYEPVGREAYVARALAEPLEFRPGAGYQYSNVGYSLLAAVVERETGRSYGAFLRDSLLLPAGLTRTGYVGPPWPADSLAHGYTERGEDWGSPLDHAWAADGPYWALRGNGGLLSTADDLLRWYRALDAGRVLTSASLAAAYAPHVPEGGGTDYGYGWTVDEGPGGGRFVWHDGGNGLYSAYVGRYLDAGVVVIVAENGTGNAAPLGETLGRIATRDGRSLVQAGTLTSQARRGLLRLNLNPVGGRALAAS